MNRTLPLRLRPAAWAASLLLAVPLAVHAQAERPSAKGTLKVQPRPSATSTVPAGVDAGTPATSNSVPLGTPTKPANEAERNDLRKASAAARAAARRKGTPVPPESANQPPVNAAAEAARTAPDSAPPGKVTLQGTPAGTPAKVSPAPSPTPSRPAR
ncbi:MAG: hypothetical protein ABIS28_17580 [Caldimonas sp.]